LMMTVGAAIQRRPVHWSNTRLFQDIVLCLWTVVHVWSMVTNLKRFATGRNGSWNIFSDGAWSPPGIGNEAVVGSFVLVGLAMFFVGRSVLHLASLGEAKSF
jgi:hypothetical protein